MKVLSSVILIYKLIKLKQKTMHPRLFNKKKFKNKILKFFVKVFGFKPLYKNNFL